MAIPAKKGEFNIGGSAPRSRPIRDAFSHSVAAYDAFMHNGRFAEAREGIAATGMQAYRAGQFGVAGQAFELEAIALHHINTESGAVLSRAAQKEEIEILGKAAASYTHAQTSAKTPEEAAQYVSKIEGLKSALTTRVIEFVYDPALELLNGTADSTDTKRFASEAQAIATRVIRRWRIELKPEAQAKVTSVDVTEPEVHCGGTGSSTYEAKATSMLYDFDATSRLSAIRSMGVGNLTSDEMRLMINDPLPLIRKMVARDVNVPFELLAERERVETDPIVKAAIRDAIESRRKGNMHAHARELVAQKKIMPLNLEFMRRRDRDVPMQVAQYEAGTVHEEKAKRMKQRNARVRKQVGAKQLHQLDEY